MQLARLQRCLQALGDVQVMTGMHIVRSEGLTGLYRGLNPAVARGLFYGGASGKLGW